MDRKDEMDFDLSKIMQEFTAQAPPAPLTVRQPQQADRSRRGGGWGRRWIGHSAC